MTTRNLTSRLYILAMLLFAGAAHAGGYSMDAGGTVVDAGSSASASTGNRDCAASTPSVTDSGNSHSGVHDSARSSAPSVASVTVVDDSGSASGGSAQGGGGATSDSISAPIKTRSSRWQSLVPGAIK